MSGLVLHPYKRSISRWCKSYLDSVIRNDQTMLVCLGLTAVELVDSAACSIGTYLTRRWKLIVSCSLLLPFLHLIIYFFPGAISGALELLQKIVFVDIISSLNTVHYNHVLICLIIFLVTLFVDRHEYKILIQISSMVTWIMLGAYLSNYLWPPVIYIFTLLWVYGYCTEPTSLSDDDVDGSPGSSHQDTRIKSVLISFLGKIGVLGQDDPEASPNKVFTDDDDKIAEDRRSSDPSPTTSTPLTTQVINKVSSPSTPDTDNLDSNKLTKVLNLESTSKVVTVVDTPKLMHPGVSKLQKEHGILKSREKLSNMSGIGKVYSNSPLGGNTPKSRVLGRSYVFKLRRRSSLHRLGTDSWTYIRYVFWSCVLIQLWVRPALGHLLPAPLAYYVIKRLANFTGITGFLLNKIWSLSEVVRNWVDERHDLFFPPPLVFILKISYNVERKLVQGTITYLDSIVTSLMILCMMLGFIIATIFISFQVCTFIN